MKRKLAIFGLCFAVAEMAAAAMPPAVLPAAIALACAAGLAVWQRERLPAAAWVLAGLALGFGYSAVYRAAHVRPVEALAGQTVSAIATVEPGCAPSYQAGMLRGTLRLEGIPGSKGPVLAQCWSFPAQQAGDSFTAEFALSALPQDRYRMGNYADGIYLEAEYLGSYSARPAEDALRFRVGALRLALRERLCRWLLRPYSGLAAAMLLGDRTLLQDETTQTFQRAGVSHLLAVSGLHISLLCGLFAFGRTSPGRRRFFRLRIAARAVLILFYMALTGFSVSVQRAGLALLVALAGELLRQPPDYLTSMGAAALFFGLCNAYAPCDVGFQLSFSAVLGVQAGAALASLERPYLPAWLAPVLETVQVSAMAAAATLPVLLAHGMATSGVAVLSNLLVVWMLRPALLLGLAVLALSVLPLQAPMRMASILLALWLRAMLALVSWCAGLPLAHLYLPRRYTLWVLAVLGALAAVFWHRRKRTAMLWYLPAAAACCAVAIALNALCSRDVVTVAMVGTAGNPCAVITQNRQAVVLFRGGAFNRAAVEEYLAGHGAPEQTLLVDIRQQPQEQDFSADSVLVLAGQETGWQTMPVSDTLALWLYSAPDGNLAVIQAGGCRLAMAAGDPALPQEVEVDVFCAGAGWPQSLLPDTVLTNTASPRWLERAALQELLYGTQTPAAIVRPGRSLTFEGVKHLAVQ